MIWVINNGLLALKGERGLTMQEASTHRERDHCEMFSLHPDHLADLKKSGLSDKTIISRKYHKKAGLGVHLYLPPLAQEVFSGPAISLYFVEGEKKAAKGCQEGRSTIGLGGLWN